MAWVTTLGPDMGQIDYRLREDAGCSLNPGQPHEQSHEHERTGEDRQVSYRLAGDRSLEWIGSGLREVGIEPGTAMDGAAKDAARLLAQGRDPRRPGRGRDGILVDPKKAVDPRAKLPALPLVRAVRVAAVAAGQSPEAFLAARADARAVARYGRLQRGVAREEARLTGVPADVPPADTGAVEGMVHTAPVKDLEGLAAAAGIDLDGLYDAGQLATAREHRDARVVVGNRGYDITFDIPKSYSVLVAMADPGTAAELEEAYLDTVRETVTAVQEWAGYGMRGHHGDGQAGERVEGTGLLGWMNVHRTARPVAGQAPDPHLHAHVTILNVVRGTDGTWSTIGAGGRDIHRHAHAADAFLRARLRQVTAERWGIRWHRDPRTGAWEVAGVPDQLRATFSKRAGQVAGQLARSGLDPAAASTAQSKQAAADSREAKQAPGPGGDLRADWHAQARAAGHDPVSVVAAAMPGPGPGAGRAPDGPDRPDRGPDRPHLGAVDRGLAGTAPEEPDGLPAELPDEHHVAAIAAYVMRGAGDQIEAKGGLTAHRKVVTRADVLAAVMDAVPAGLPDLATGQRLTDAVLDQAVAVALPAAGQTHLTNATRYTSTEIVTAERQVLAAARDRHGAGFARVDGDVVDLAVETFEASAGFTLSGEQRAVLTRLATAGNGVETVVGVAGAGKTTLMAALRNAHEAAGHTVAGAATAAVAAKNLQREAGIPARTVAAWLSRIDRAAEQGGPPALAGVDVLVLDEAAMVDDRHVARLLAAAGATGTQVVAIGDPQQLRAVGVGGTFAAVHRLIAGGELTENRRQRDTTERAALAAWRTGERAAAVRAWADAGRVHVTAGAADAHAAMVTAWDAARRQWDDPYERCEQLLLLAHTNADVEALNTRARQLRGQRGELGEQVTITLPDGAALSLAVGDQVITRRNDRDLGVLNGQRGLVTAIDPGDRPDGDGNRGLRVAVTRRETGPDGPVPVTVWLPAGYLAGGHTGPGLTHAYAITAAKAQGLTADRALVYGIGMDAHVLYPAMSRDRRRTDLYLALDLLEDDATRARHGTPTTDRQVLQRAVDAYTATLDTPPDTLVSTQLDDLDQLHLTNNEAADNEAADNEAADNEAADIGAVPDWWLRAPSDTGHLEDGLQRQIRAEIEAMNTRPYGWTATHRLRDDLQAGDLTDVGRRRQDLTGRADPQERADRLAAAARQAEPLLDRAQAHQTAADAAEQSAARQAQKLSDLHRRAEDRQAHLQRLQALAARPLTGRRYRHALDQVHLDHQAAVHALDQARRRIDDALTQADHHHRQAVTLADEAARTVRQATLLDFTRPSGQLSAPPPGTAPEQVRQWLDATLHAAAAAVDADHTRRQARLDDVAAELAYRDGLPTDVAQATDAVRLADQGPQRTQETLHTGARTHPAMPRPTLPGPLPGGPGRGR